MVWKKMVWLACWILLAKMYLCSPSCNLSLARFSAMLKDGPSVAKIVAPHPTKNGEILEIIMPKTFFGLISFSVSLTVARYSKYAFLMSVLIEKGFSFVLSRLAAMSSAAVAKNYF